LNSPEIMLFLQTIIEILTCLFGLKLYFGDHSPLSFISHPVISLCQPLSGKYLLHYVVICKFSGILTTNQFCCKKHFYEFKLWVIWQSWV